MDPLADPALETRRMSKKKHINEQNVKKMVKKMVFITAWLVEDSEAYISKTNADIEKEILEDIGLIPYVAKIEKVTVLDC